MSHSGVGVGAMSHKRERYESEWSKCGSEKKRVRVHRNNGCSFWGKSYTPFLQLSFYLIHYLSHARRLVEGGFRWH